MVDSRSRALRLAAALVVTLGAGSVGLLGAPASAAGSATEPQGSAEVQLLANCYDTCTLNVILSGNGSGTFKSTNSLRVPNGLINCTWLNGAQAPGSDCTEQYCCVDRVSPVTVYFTLTPTTGSRACYQDLCADGEVNSYTDLPSVNTPITKTIGATFNVQTHTVIISRSGTAASDGAINSVPTGILCPPDCSETLEYGTEVLLHPYTGVGSYFAGWSGACAGQATNCTVTVTGPISATAIFTLGTAPTPSPPAPTPLVTPVGTAKPADTPKPTRTPGTGPAQTTAPTTLGPPSAGVVSAPPTSSDVPSASLSGPNPGASIAATIPIGSEPPAAPAAAGTDLSPIALAILGAGLLIAVGIGVAGFLLTRRRGAPPA